MKLIIQKIKNKTASEFDVQDLIKFFAENIESMNVADELVCKEYIRKGANQLGIHPKDVQDVFNSFRKKV